MSTVRRDRKFLTSLRLHERVLVHLDADPERVRTIGLERVGVRRVRARGGALTLLDEWERVLLDRDWAALRAYATGDDERSTEMRHLAVFGGVLSASERRAVLDRVHTEIAAEACHTEDAPHPGE